MSSEDDDFRDEDLPPVPSGRVLWIMERHALWKQRKAEERRRQRSQVRVHANVEPDAAPEVKAAVVAAVECIANQEEPCPETTSAPTAPAATSGGDTPASPSPSVSAASTADSRSHTPRGVDYLALIRVHGPISQKDLAAIAKVSGVSVCLWLKRHAARHGIETITGRPKLYRVGPA